MKTQLQNTTICEELEGYKEGFVAMQLTQEQSRLVRKHLFTCERCAKEFAEEVYQAFQTDSLPPILIPALPVPTPVKHLFIQEPHYKILFTQAVEVKTSELPRLKPQI